MKGIVQTSVTALCLCSAVLLSACGGATRFSFVSDPPPPGVPPPTQPPPPPAPVEPCPAPITSNCIVETVPTPTWNELAMTGGRQSDHRLFVWGPGGWLNLKDGEYRFSGGTEIAGATLVVWDTLISDVNIAHDFTGLGFEGKSELWLTGTVRGSVSNDELLSLRHKCGTGLNVCTEDRRSRIEGNYVQGETGRLEAVLGWDLQITGTAWLDGDLMLLRGTSKSYVLPTAPSSVLVLRAAGGLTGQFTQWGAQGLFLEGALRYTANDVYFDATRISVAATMAAAGVADAGTLASARNLDRAFGRADGYARDATEALTPSQQRFLESAASIQHIGDMHQATRSLDSLSGHGYVQASDALHGHAAASAAALQARLARQSYRAGPVPWSHPLAATGASSGRSLVGQASGTDYWLSPRMLVGASVSDGRAAMDLDRMGGQVDGTSPMASVHAYYRSGRWHASGQVGAGHSQLWSRRTIDLGDAGEHLARSRRAVDQVFVHAEFGSELALGAGRLGPFVAFDHSTLRSNGATEQGATGMELVLDPARSTQSFASAGVRYAHDWDTAATRWQFNLDARYQHRITADDAQYAAFVGTPDATFDLADWSRPAGAGVVNLGLVGDIGRLWSGAFEYRHEFGIDESGGGWFVGLRREL